MAVTSHAYIRNYGAIPAFFDSGRYGHRIRRFGNEYFVDRTNSAKYRTTRKTSGPYASIALAQAACDTDVQLTRPSGVTPTTTTAGFTQPAVGATVVVPVAATTGLAVGMCVTVATAGVFQITVIAALNLTLRNTGAAENAAPTTVIATTKSVTATAGPG
jgi:hypothetical protein